MEQLAAIFRQRGQVCELTVNNPLMLCRPDVVWWVEAGELGLYSVGLHKGEPDGKRFYFVNIAQGKLVFGFPQEAQALGILADAFEPSTLYEMPMAALQEIYAAGECTEEIAQAVDTWLNTVFRGITENANHPNETMEMLVEADERLILMTDDSLSAQRKVVWAKISNRKYDQILFNGTEDITAPEDTEILIPLTRHSFLKSRRNVGMRFLNTTQALSSPEAWHGLGWAHQAILQLENAEMLWIIAQEQSRIQAKYEAQFTKAQAELRQARALLDASQRDYYTERFGTDTDEPLLKACRIVAEYHHIKIPLMDYAADSPDALGDIMRAANVRYRAVKLSDDWFATTGEAMLGFAADTQAPLALMPKREGKGYEAYNPATQETIDIRADNATRIDRLGYVLYAPLPEREVGLWDLLRFGIFRQRRDFYRLLGAAFGASVIGLLMPLLTGILFDEIIPAGDNRQILQVGIALFIALMGVMLFETTENLALLRLETLLDSRLQSAVWDRLLNLPATFFRGFTAGDLADRAMGINDIRRMLSGAVITGALGSIFSLLNFALMFYYSVWLALAALGITLVQVLGLYVLGQRQVRREKTALAWQGRTQGVVLQLLTGIAKFRVTGTEMRAFTHWLAHFRQWKKHAFRATQAQNTQNVVNVLMPLVSALILYSVLFSSHQSLSTGEFLAFMAGYGAFSASLLGLSAALLTLYQVIPIYERTRPILDTMPESDRDKINPGKIKGKIEVSQVSFRYSPNTPLVLEDVSLKLDAGDYVALVGPSGSGKSSLVRLLLGFEQPESGSIFIDDQDLTRLDIRLVRRQIGTVLQDGQLQPGDILSNIVGASPHLSQNDAWEAAKLAGLDDDIRQMPMQMHTVINEGATTLSGGQRQRLLIAQVLVHKPKIVIFDEATSALDNRTQDIVTQSLGKLQATRIVIAHRLSTIRQVDKVFVMDKGRIVQQGTYDELMAQAGLFRDLANRQVD